MSKGRILVTGTTLPIIEELLSSFGQVEVTRNTDEQSLIALMQGTIAVIARGMTQISGAVIHAGKDLRVIGRTGSGYDSIDLEAATGRRIPVVYAPGAGARAVAEGTLCMTLACAKRLKEFDVKMANAQWEAREEFALGDLEEAVLGIVGLGRIGREVARLAKSFGMRILTHDPFISPQTAEHSGAELVQLEELLAKSDFISLHAPLNTQTRGMINRERLERVKKGAILINLARGGLIASLDVLEESLAHGRLSAVGLDVYPEEPPRTSHPIFRRPNVICTPHVMGLSQRAAHATFAAVSKGMAAVLTGKIPDNVVNPEVFGVRNY
ncbi:MAG: hydroxyacid dehydrogenase [Candidatus Sulfotelmatobacter sp.]